MPLRAVLRTISLFLSLATFLVVGINSLSTGEELLWAVAKAFLTFVVCWLVINWLAGLLSMSVEGIQCSSNQPAEQPGDRKGARRPAAHVTEE